MSDPKNPWTHAAARRYLNPEDIMTAADAGADRRKLMACVLDAIHRGEAEDPRLCAFVALHEEPFGYERPQRTETASPEPECTYVGRCNSNRCPKHGGGGA